MQVGLFILTAGANELKEVAIREMLFIKINALIHQRHVSAQQATTHVAHTPAGEQNQPSF